MNSTWLNACGGGAGRLRSQGVKKRPDEGEDLNALVANTAKAVLTTNKRKKAKALSESGLEDDQEHFNFETLKIGSEWQTARMPQSNDAEILEEGTKAEEELYTISHLINPTKKGKINITYLYH